MGKKKEEATVVVAEPVHLPAPQNNTELRTVSAEELIAQGIEKDISVENMERLMAMRRELRAEQSKEAYDLAMAQFQAECPIIEKKKAVKEKDKKTDRYKYAPIDVIVKQVKPILQKHGFSYTIDAQMEDKWVTALCKSTHSKGHSEVSTFKVPIDPESYMSQPQRFAAALTFAKRYAFCNAFGILTGDEDTDAVGDAPPPAANSKDLFEKAKRMISNAKDTGGLIEYAEKLKNSTAFDEEQKKELNTLLSSRVDQLDNKTG